MTKLHIMSDLHLEFSTFEPPSTDADIIILAGDIANGCKGVHWARKTFPDKIICYVVGNHEFYGSQRQETLSLIKIAGQQCGVHILDDAELIPEQHYIRILGCTMWTDFCLYGEENKQRAMDAGFNGLNDFRLIHDKVIGFTPEKSIDLHKKSLAWLMAKLDEPFDGKTVVMMHHLPSMLSVADRFKDDILSACFASNLDFLFEKNIDLIVHGHTHSNFDYTENGTRVLCNPRGYVTYQGQENFDFNHRLVIEI